MAKKGTAMPKAKPTEPAEVVVEYDLFDLPTAFHKAGLAGLILLIESLKARSVLTDDEARWEGSAVGARITFSESLVRKVMDDLYDARLAEVLVKSKWKDAELKREELVEEVVDGKTTKSKRFVYDQVQPRGAFFDNVFDGEKEVWRKLWREMLWNIPRGRPTTREPYNQRAAGQPCKEGPNAWAELVKFDRARSKGSLHTAELSSALFPGAQAVNAESIPFEGRAEQNLLLHFWPLTALLFVPQEIDRDGSTNLPPASYSVAVPDVTHLTRFLRDYPALLRSRTGEVRGYRPAQAVIDLPPEGALAFLDDLAVVAGLQVERGELRFSIGGVEYLHLVKEGNNVKAMAAGRVNPSRRLLERYRAIVRSEGKAVRYRNPLFRRGLLAALLDDSPWHHPFARILSMFDDAVFLRPTRRSEDEKGPPSFAADVAAKLRDEARLYYDRPERRERMPEALERPAPPAVIVNRVVKSYLLDRSQAKSGVDPGKFRTTDGDIDYSAIPGEFNETKNKLAQGLFLEFRSRRDQAFVDHFAATFFGVTQRLNESDRLELADLLTSADRRDDLKTLTLLALSANS